MATFSFPTVTFNNGGDAPNTRGGASVTINDISVSSSSFTIPNHSVTYTMGIQNTSVWIQARTVSMVLSYDININGVKRSSVDWGASGDKAVPSTSSWATATATGTNTTSTTIYTSDLFNTSNPTTLKLPLTLKRTYTAVGTPISWNDNGTALSISGTAYVTLNAPPTFNETFSYIGDYSGVPYAGLTTAKVKLSSLSAKYGGNFSGVGKAEFTIGSVTATKANPANNDELSIVLNAVGTFTPTVKVTDSRGQVTTHTLPAITVMGYTAPSVSFDTERTTSTGSPNDEGTYAVINPKFTFTDAIATLSAPTIGVTDEDGVGRTPTVTWYSTRAADGTLSGSVTWSNLSSGDTVYGLVSITNGFNTQKSYQISVTPQDSEDSGTTITQTLASAFYTVDFLAGGHGIAFGQPASEEGFECNMSALFKDDLLLDLPEYTTSGTTDKAIYDACVALGWDSDVLVN